MADVERQVAQQTQEKFQFYTVGLVFTILALSVQTASFEGHLIARISEIAAWLTLLVSGLTGLSRIEWAPLLRVKMALKGEFEDKVIHFQQQQRNGVRTVFVLERQQQVPIEERIAEYQKHITTLEEFVQNVDKRAELKYTIFKSAFLIGIALLVLARAYDPVQAIVVELCS